MVRSASLTELPVTTMFSAATPSVNRFARLVLVGAKCRRNDLAGGLAIRLFREGGKQVAAAMPGFYADHWNAVV